MSELTRVAEWIVTTLAADSTIAAFVDDRIFRDLAPEGTEYPLILFSYQGAVDSQGVGTARIQTRALYQIALIEKGFLTDDGDAVEQRIDALIGRATAETLNGYAFEGRRQYPISFTELTSGVRFTKTGGLYQIDVWEA